MKTLQLAHVLNTTRDASKCKVFKANEREKLNLIHLFFKSSAKLGMPITAEQTRIMAKSLHQYSDAAFCCGKIRLGQNLRDAGLNLETIHPAAPSPESAALK